jgi:hypothetical protein
MLNQIHRQQIERKKGKTLFNTTAHNGAHLWVERSQFRPRRQAWAIHMNNQDGKIVAYCERHADIFPTIRNWADSEIRMAQRYLDAAARIAAKWNGN